MSASVVITIFNVTVLIYLFAVLCDAARTPSPPPDGIKTSPNLCGVLKPLENAHLLQLKGKPYERGFAHGFLLAEQIIDWSYFYQFSYNMRGNITQYNEYTVWLRRNQFVPQDYREEVRGMMDGMKQSSANLFLEEMGRDFNEIDIYAINSYLEGTPGSGALQNGPYTFVRRDREIPIRKQGAPQQAKTTPPACTQFVAWGHITADEDTIAGRNMDGETDPWMVTVTHLIVFAVEPEPDSGRLRFVSVMWPGHIGTLSAVNEQGVTAMLNCGTMGQGPVASNITAIEWTIRDIISSTPFEEATPQQVLTKLNRYRGSQGGVSAAGSVIVFSRSHLKGIATADPGPAGFIAELDRFGGLIRSPYDARSLPAIYESNHFIEYGVDSEAEADPVNPVFNFGEEVGFSSRFRLEALRAVVESINRTADSISTRLRGLDATYGAPRAIRAAAHGFTEHSIAVHANSLVAGSRPRIALANSNAQRTAALGAWDAPYGLWVEYDFDDLFRESQ